MVNYPLNLRSAKNRDATLPLQNSSSCALDRTGG
jgi:hypothetical protein